MRKGIVNIVLVILVSGLTFTGCGKSAVSPGTPNASGTTQSTVTKTFTLEELKKYNGQNGNPAYVAINGIVYDVTNARRWSNGQHQGYSSGQDLTEALKNSPHGDGVLKDLPIVGKIAG